MTALLIVFFITYSCVVFAVGHLWFLLGCSIFNLILIFTMFFAELLKRVINLENALIARGYAQE